MALIDHVTLAITQDSVGISRAGFGTPLLASHNASFAESTRIYTSLVDVQVDFVATSPESLAATAIFAQSPKPTRLKIAKLGSAPTKACTLNIATVRDSHKYEIIVKGEGVTPETIDFTSDSTATDGEIVIGLVAALNAVVGKNFTAAGATSPFTVTGDAAGDWFSLEIVDVTDITLQEDHADPGINAELTALVLEDNDWYTLHTFYNSVAYVAAAAAWIETQKKIYVFDVNDTDAIQVAEATSTDVIDDIDEANYKRSMGAYHQAPDQMMAAAWMGRLLPTDPGSATWKFKTLSGVVVRTLSATQRSNLTDKRGNGYEESGGLSHTFEGTVGDNTRAFMDTTRFIDFLEDDMTKEVFGILAGADKIPYTDDGVAAVEAGVRAALRRGVDSGGLAEDPEPTVTVPKVADVASADKALRLLPDIKFSATLAGAVHKVEITGVISV